MNASPAPSVGEPIRIVRVIARLNIGGPAIQAITVTDRLTALGYVTTLVRGREAEREGRMDDLAEELGVSPVLISTLRRDPGWHDLPALISLIRILRREQPHIIHTHAAKAGTLGRVASLISGRGGRRATIRVHTFHGHSLTGYFAPRTAAVYRAVERILAWRTDALIAVSEEVRDELIALGVAPAERFEVVPLGFDLSRFAVDGEARYRARAAVRTELCIPEDAAVVTLVARLVPIKRVDRFLRACAALLDLSNVRFLLVGDGELRESLLESTAALTLGDRLVWTGFRRDIPEVCFASDVVALTSDNEGTPVSLIEAAAAGLPAVSTAVGGAAKVVRDGETGLLVARDDESALSCSLRKLVTDDAARARMGASARVHALQTFGLERLVRDLDELYRRLLGAGTRASV